MDVSPGRRPVRQGGPSPASGIPRINVNNVPTGQETAENEQRHRVAVSGFLYAAKVGPRNPPRLPTTTMSAIRRRRASGQETRRHQPEGRLERQRAHDRQGQRDQ